MAGSVNSQRLQYANSQQTGPAVAVTIASTHYTYWRMDGQAELAWMT